MVNVCILSVIAFVIGIGGILTVTLIYSLTGRVIPLDYGVVVDAGSTHSQLTLYKWLGNKERDTGFVEQKASCYVPGGLAHQTDPVVAADSLKECLVNISAALSKEEVADTSIFLGATAGFRILNETDSQLSDSILLEVNKTFSTFGYNPEQVRILTGDEEALYGWITSNFLTSTLTETPPDNTVGAMDLGGASTQIAFSDHSVAVNDSFYLMLYGYEHYVTTSSSLCFGVEESYRRHLFELIQDNKTSIAEPCAPVNYTFEKSYQDLFDQPCTTGPQRSSQQVMNYTFYGTGNFETCMEQVSSLLNVSRCLEKYEEKHCFQPVTPSTNKKFYAFSSFFYTMSFLNMTNSSLAQFQNASHELCGKAWQEVQVMPTTSKKDLPHFCFQAILIDQMLTGSYSFNETTWGNIFFVKELNSSDAGWSLGYMINATNAIPAEAPTNPSISLVVMILIIILCVILLANGSFFVWKKMKLSSSEVSYVQV